MLDFHTQNLFALGCHYSSLRWPINEKRATVVESLAIVIQVLTSMKAGEQFVTRLQACHDDIKRRIEPDEKKPTGFLEAAHFNEVSFEEASEVREVVNEVFTNWYSPTFSTQRARLLIDTDPIQHLKWIAEVFRTQNQKRLAREVIHCFEVGAFRSATVMAWLLTYDFFRDWIFRSKRKRLKDFNALLVTRNRTKTQTYDAIAQYSDFDELGERFVIDLAHEAKLIRKQAWQILSNALIDRNHLAHPSSKEATHSTTAGYVENLMVNFILSGEFK